MGSDGIDGADPLDQVEAFLTRGRVAGVVEVEDGQIEVGRLDALDRLDRRARLDHLEAFVEEQQAQRVEDVGLVVGDQDAGWTRVGHWRIHYSSRARGFAGSRFGRVRGKQGLGRRVSRRLSALFSLFAGPHPREPAWGPTPSAASASLCSAPLFRSP